jgi:hypothetical protein
MTEWRQCAHCRRRYLWRSTWQSNLCPRCNGLLERAQNAEKPAGYGVVSESAGNAGNARQVAPDGQYWLPGCDPLSL